jgi:hypothetical protein
MLRPIASLSVLAAVVAFTGASSHAALVITEAMSNGGATDWFELTNAGAADVNITGYKMDDSSYGFATSVALNNVTTIPAGKSAVFLETANDTAIDAFKTQWGLSAGAIVGRYNGSGVGLSADPGDGIVVFDGAGNEVTDRIAFGVATTGTSFIRAGGGTTGAFGSLSVSGVAGAFTSPGTPTNIGSPGTVATPEPTTLAALSLVGLLARRRRA